MYISTLLTLNTCSRSGLQNSGQIKRETHYSGGRVVTFALVLLIIIAWESGQWEGSLSLSW